MPNNNKVLSRKERAVLLQGPDYQTDYERLRGATFVVDANLLFRLYSLGSHDRSERLDVLVAVDAGCLTAR